MGPSGREVISLQKVDSLLVLVYVREAKKFSALLGGGVWIKIHLNPKRNSTIFETSYPKKNY
jgi:hypothetical protein